MPEWSLVQNFDHTETSNYALTDRERFLIQSALAFLEDNYVWSDDTDTDERDALLASLVAKI